jgi:hypothetical protein
MPATPFRFRRRIFAATENAASLDRAKLWRTGLCGDFVREHDPSPTFIAGTRILSKRPTVDQAGTGVR